MARVPFSTKDSTLSRCQWWTWSNWAYVSFNGLKEPENELFKENFICIFICFDLVIKMLVFILPVCYI